MLKKYYDYEDINIQDFFKPGIRETFQFIGRFSNSVAISKTLALNAEIRSYCSFPFLSTKPSIDFNSIIGIGFGNLPTVFH